MKIINRNPLAANHRIGKLMLGLAGVLSISLLATSAQAEIREHTFKVAIAVGPGAAHYDGGAKFCELLDKKSGG